MIRLYQRLISQFNIRAAGIILLFVQDAVLINKFGKVYFGEFVFFVSVIQVIAIIGVFGQNNFIVFLISKYQKLSQTRFIPHVVIFGVLVAFLGTILLSLIGILLKYFFIPRNQLNLPMVVITSSIFGVFEVIRQTFRAISKESIADSLSLICVPSIVILLALSSDYIDIHDRPEYLYSFAVLMSLIITLVIFIHAKPGFKDLPTMGYNKPFINTAKMNRLRLIWFRRGFPLTVSGLFTTFQQRIDVVILGIFINAEGLAIYQILSRFSLLSLFVLRSIQSILLAPFANIILSKSFESGIKVLRRSVVLSLIGAFLSYIAIWLFEPAVPYFFSFEINKFESEFLILFIARGALVVSGGAPLLLQMTVLRTALPIILTFAIVLFFLVLLSIWVIYGEITMYGMGVALFVFNGVYAFSCYFKLRKYLKLSSLHFAQ